MYLLQRQQPTQVLIEDPDGGILGDVGWEDGAIGAIDTGTFPGEVRDLLVAVEGVNKTEFGNIHGAREHADLVI